MAAEFNEHLMFCELIKEFHAVVETEGSSPRSYIRSQELVLSQINLADNLYETS